MSLGPTARRRRLGTSLAELRSEAQRSLNEAADHIGCSAGKIRNWEAGRSGIKKFELTALLDYYRTPQAVRGLLEDLRREGAQRGWWSTYRLPEWFKPYVGLEQAAVEVRNFEIELIPGLLQTKAYAREIHSAGTHITDPSDVEKRVAARMERQQRLWADEPLRLSAVVSEAALHRQIGGAEVMAEQLHHLRSLGRLPNVVLQILPSSVGTHPSLAGGFTFLRFAESADPDVGWTENPLGGNVIEDRDDVATLRTMFDELQRLALSKRDSTRLLARMLAESTTP
ncbi:helix-turn-helix domain-containing protein [Actinoalloteichus hymeniacidonis]|uniref:DNA binding protein with helix-turn-helix domain n=1 Tax=Actinoalloteichus hymeniacidonis TaxID=340345 RepID=A0AAC9HQQ5_9PSEU|nr:helix-turn-helix transcriptional regulator [Actinoalloteichus hymeniacidonis]AOS63832.1 DNA binding protein with helix-turn-helix domain [Actinoalloteichus hymeniacidonis]